MELDIGPGLEDAGDVPERVLALSALAGCVVLKHHVRCVHRSDALHIVGVPRVVVGGDRFAQLVCRSCHAHSIGLSPLDRGAEIMSTLAGRWPPLLTARK